MFYWNVKYRSINFNQNEFRKNLSNHNSGVVELACRGTSKSFEFSEKLLNFAKKMVDLQDIILPGFELSDYQRFQNPKLKYFLQLC